MRETPQSFEAEQALLGAILANNAAYHNCAELLTPQHFSDPLHGKMWDTIAKLIERGQVVNLFSLKAYFEQEPDLKAAGGPSYLARMMAASVHAIDAPTFARIIRDTAIRRRIIAVADDALASAYAPRPDDTAAEQIERLEKGLYDIAEGAIDEGFARFTTGLTKAISAADAAHKRDGKLTGISTGLRGLDDLLGGLHRSDLVILAGRPSMGKTALATNIAVHAASQHRTEQGPDGQPRTVDGARVGFFSLEMSCEQLATRILADKAGVSSERVRRGQLSSAEFDRVLTASTALESLALSIDDTPALTINGLRTRARRLKRQQGLDLIVVDYLQLVDATNRRDGRVQEVSEITRGLKTLAKELDVPVLALSQLSRAVEQRQDKRPQLSDLRDSGSIEQDADVVMFVYREEYYLERNPDADPAAVQAAAGKAEVAIAKQRHGPTGTAYLKFDGALTRFTDAPPPAAARSGVRYSATEAA